jgi:hypothetical protein
MPSDYLAFVLFFGLALTMAVVVNVAVNSATIEIQEAAAVTQLDKIVDLLQSKILTLTSNPAWVTNSIFIEEKFSLPVLLSDHYSYEISFSTSGSSTYTVVAAMKRDNIPPAAIQTYSSSFLTTTYTLSGSIDSLQSVHQISVAINNGIWDVTVNSG